MTDEAREALADRQLVKAEYEAEFADDPEGEAELARYRTNPAELAELLGPSRRDRTQKIILAFTKRIREAEREVAEMQEREVALKLEAKRAQEHSEKLGAERNQAVEAMVAQDEFRALRQENGELRTRLRDAELGRTPIEMQQENSLLKRRVAELERPGWWRKLWGKR